MQPQNLTMAQATRCKGCNTRRYVGVFQPFMAVLGRKLSEKVQGTGLGEAGSDELLLPENTL